MNSLCLFDTTVLNLDLLKPHSLSTYNYKNSFIYLSTYPTIQQSNVIFETIQ